MIKLKVNEIEKRLGKKLSKNITSVGVDTASRAGVCIASADKDYLYLDVYFIDIDSTDIYFKYNKLIESFKQLFSQKFEKSLSVIIEDTFFGRNVNVLKMISRMGMIVYMCASELKDAKIQFIYPTTSRKNLNIKGTLKKQEVHKELFKLIGKKLPDEDISDAVVLALYGLTEENTLI